MNRYRCHVQPVNEYGWRVSSLPFDVEVLAHHPREAATLAVRAVALPSLSRAMVSVGKDGFTWGYDVTREPAHTYHAREVE